MSNLLAARWQMAMSLGFHIIFAVIGIALPLLMVIAEFRWIKTGDPVYKILAKRWARGAAILFAVGAVSGTVLSFELGLLWPAFMKFAGPIIGVGFGLEGFAFFTEAIFLGIYLYGWDRIPKWAHLFSGGVVALSGALSGILVVSVNAWMNTPRGLTMVAGKATSIEPLGALWNDAMLGEAIHMTLAAYAATGMMVAGIHAWLLLKDKGNPFHRKALAIGLWVGGIASILQPLSGHYAAQVVARTQPLKLAAMEGLFKSQTYAPLHIGGLPDSASETMRYSIEIPGGLSLLAFNNPSALVQGLEIATPADRPPVMVVHLAFQLMVACGSVMSLLAVIGGYVSWKTGRVPDSSWFLRALVLSSPLGMIAIEAGWTVTEVGRQPWIIHGLLRTTDAVTTVQGLWISLASYSALYVFLGFVVARLLRHEFQASPSEAEIHAEADLIDHH